LEKEIANQKNISIPKQKFSFKTKKPTTTTTSQENKNNAEVKNNNNGNDTKNNENNDDNNNDTDRHKTKKNDENKTARDGVEVKNKKGETIEVKEEAQTLFLIGLNECKVIATSKGSVFVENCHNCKLFIRSQQIRIHGSRDCEVWLEVLSNPIIEQSSSFKFHPLKPSSSSDSDKENKWHKVESDSDSDKENKWHKVESDSSSDKENKWDKVEDFNWLKPNIPSPNFSLVYD